MKKIIKSLSFILLACFIFVSIPFNAKALNMTDETLNFAKKQIILLSDSLEESNWNDSSEIYNIITLYDLDDNINGYIYEIRTNGSDSGFIQVDISTGENVVSSFAYRGIHSVNKMLSKYKEHTGNVDINKIIYLGGYHYFIKNNNNNFKKSSNKDIELYALNSSEYISSDLTTLRNKYKEDILKKKSYNEDTLIKKSHVGNIVPTGEISYTVQKYVLNAQYDILVEMNDFAGKQILGWTITNHCSPTAGTNLIKYWTFKRGVTNLYVNSDWWVFSSLVQNMKTHINNGTLRDDIYTGLWNYGVNTRGIQPSGADKIITNSTYSKAKSIIDANVPFIVSLNSYGGINGGHSVSCFGYYELIDGTSKINYLIINNGWNKDWTFEKYNNLNIDRYTYVRWD